jgi:hypothetical protein
MLGVFSIWALAMTYGHTQSTRVARGASFCQASKLKHFDYCGLAVFANFDSYVDRTCFST